MSFRIKGRQSKTRAQYVIQKNAMGIFEDTKPEVLFDELCFKYGFFVRKPTGKDSFPAISYRDKTVSLRPDRIIQMTNGFSFLVQVDGTYHHKGIRYAGERTRQENKDRWRDRSLVERGYRVIHIAAELLLIKGFWSYVNKELIKFGMSEEKVRYVHA